MKKITPLALAHGTYIIGENEDVIRIMSIHKSKGLEFPVVFLCGTGNWFNLTDLNDNILIHYELGLGPKYINYERKITYNTLAKEAIRCELRRELKEEEMRLLYVALTRAREKLIITGIDKNLEKSIKNKEEILQTNGGKPTKAMLQNAKSFLDWIEIVNLSDSQMKNLVNVYEYKKNERFETEKCNKEDEKTKREKRKINPEIDKILTWEYPNIEETKIEGKSSVSKIAKKTEEPIEQKKVRPSIMSHTPTEYRFYDYLDIQCQDTWNHLYKMDYAIRDIFMRIKTNNKSCFSNALRRYTKDFPELNIYSLKEKNKSEEQESLTIKSTYEKRFHFLYEALESNGFKRIANEKWRNNEGKLYIINIREVTE